jgi:diacylglycerol kinase (ATP)
MSAQGVGGLQRIVNAFGYTIAGFRACYRHEAAFRQELLLVLLLLPLALWLGADGVERALLVGSLILIPLVELLNSAIEAVVDRFGAERHELCGRAKDLGSAAVFVSFLLATCVWLLVLGPRYIPVVFG